MERLLLIEQLSFEKELYRIQIRTRGKCGDSMESSVDVPTAISDPSPKQWMVNLLGYLDKNSLLFA
ncbi:hypothetical protein [Pseudomonas aeruginosa]|nr:hypothetical protein [Pseudomonas aeruginosa]